MVSEAFYLSLYNNASLPRLCFLCAFMVITIYLLSEIVPSKSSSTKGSRTIFSGLVTGNLKVSVAFVMFIFFERSFSPT
jgi:hypothetical protein